MDIIVRSETESDIDAITQVTRAAFAGHPCSNQKEEFIVHAVRRNEALSVSLVAEAGGKVMGDVALSPVTVSDGSPGWYGLGPFSVLPDLQRRGIGKALMREVMVRMEAREAAGCMLVGDPGCYEQFGFRNVPELVLDGVPEEDFLVLPLRYNVSSGNVAFHKSFSATC